MEDREAYKEKMAAQLEEWSDQIGVLETRVKKANAEVRLRRAEEMHELRVTRRKNEGTGRGLRRSMEACQQKDSQSHGKSEIRRQRCPLQIQVKSYGTLCCSAFA